MSVSMLDSEGKSFENPSYDAGEETTAKSTVTNVSGPDGATKVSTHQPLLVSIPH